MEHTNVFIDEKAVSLLMRKVYLAFLFYFSLYVPAQAVIHLRDSTTISIGETSSISEINSENTKTKIYILEGTSSKNFDTQNLANADIIQLEEKKYLVKKEIISKSVEKSFKNISKTKKSDEFSPHFAICSADSGTYYLTSKSDSHSFIIPLSLKWDKTLLSPTLKIKKGNISQQIDHIYQNERYHLLSYSKSFKVRPPPVVV